MQERVEQTDKIDEYKQLTLDDFPLDLLFYMMSFFANRYELIPLLLVNKRFNSLAKDPRFKSLPYFAEGNTKNYLRVQDVFRATDVYYSSDRLLLVDTICMPTNNSLSLLHHVDTDGKETPKSLILMWCGKTGNLLKNFPISNGSSTISVLTYKHMISACNNTLSIWNTESGAEIKTLSFNDLSSIRKILSISAQEIVVASAHELHIINLSTSKILHTLKGHLAPVRDIIALQNGQIASVDDNNGDIFIWDIKTASLKYHLDLTQIKPENEPTLGGKPTSKQSLVANNDVNNRCKFTLKSFNDGSLVFNFNGMIVDYMYKLQLNKTLNKWEAIIREIFVAPEKSFLVLPGDKIAFPVRRANINGKVDVLKIIDLFDDEFKAKHYSLGSKGWEKMINLQNNGSIMLITNKLANEPQGKYKISSTLFSYPELNLELNSTPQP